VREGGREVERETIQRGGETEQGQGGGERVCRCAHTHASERENMRERRGEKDENSWRCITEMKKVGAK